MQVVKKVNNNVVICKDGYGRELVAFGRGLGFQQTPYEITDLSKIQRTFYDISPQYLAMMETLPADIIEFTSAVVDMARATLPYQLSPNLLLTLADHIAFAMERKKKGIFVKMPLAYDLEQTYPQEVKLGRRVLRSIWTRFHVRLPDDEASGIAMSFINARLSGSDADDKDQINDRMILDEITHIIENCMGKKLDVTSFNYARYATHVQYLLARLHSGKGIDSINQDVYDSLRKEYAETSACVDSIVLYLKNNYGFEITDEEKLYLILHINRVCTGEGL